MSWSAVAFLAALSTLVGLAWAAARAAGRADAELDTHRLARDAEEIAREIRRDVAREPDPDERLRNEWQRD